MPVTRRHLVAAFAVLPLAKMPAAAQTAPPIADKLQKAYAEVQESGMKLRQIDVPMALDPAFVFEP
ncbi:MAG TPA: hypothetical protein VH351_22170 [Bryobacteraceae bacterium]|jgi:hypothetical protein|nr:hypothetical protein [Bryobacteraceae bacterium]